MKLKTILKLIFLCLFMSNISYTQTVYRIRLSSSSYSAQLRGVTGTVTAGISLTGVYSSTYRAHEFQVSVTGAYELYIDELGGSSYSEDTNWDDGLTGKVIYGSDLTDHIHGHGSGSGDKIATADLVDLSITTGKINNLAVTTAKLNNDAITTDKIANNDIKLEDLQHTLLQNQSASVDSDSVHIDISSYSYTSPKVILINKSNWHASVKRVTTSQVVLYISPIGSGSSVIYDLLIMEE